MSQEQSVSSPQEELINFLQQHSITYIYDPKDANDGRSWINVNTDHMLYIFNRYHRKLEGINYTIIIKFNELEKYISRDYNSIVNYFKENNKEFTNDTHKIVAIKYDLDL
jgi:hypothetical protein